MKPIQKTRYIPLIALVLACVLSSQALADTARSIEVKVNGLVCAFCAQGITKAFEQQAATEEVFVSLERQLVAIALKAQMDMDDALVTDTLVDAGYDVVAITRTNRSLSMIRDGDPMAQAPMTMDHHTTSEGHDHGHNNNHNHNEHHGSHAMGTHHDNTNRP